MENSFLPEIKCRFLQHIKSIAITRQLQMMIICHRPHLLRKGRDQGHVGSRVTLLGQQAKRILDSLCFISIKAGSEKRGRP